MAFDIEMIKKVYANMAARVDKARELVGRPLTLTEKILYTHLWEGTATQAFTRGIDYVDFAPDRVACKMQRHKWLYCNLCMLVKKQ